MKALLLLLTLSSVRAGAAEPPAAVPTGSAQCLRHGGFVFERRGRFLILDKTIEQRDRQLRTYLDQYADGACDDECRRSLLKDLEVDHVFYDEDSYDNPTHRAKEAAVRTAYTEQLKKEGSAATFTVWPYRAHFYLMRLAAGVVPLALEHQQRIEKAERALLREHGALAFVWRHRAGTGPCGPASGSRLETRD